MKLDKVILLGDPRLYQTAQLVEREEVESLKPVIQDLHDIIFEFRAKYKAGRGIAAPQIGVMKRLIYIHIDRPMIIINPELSELSEEKFVMWDDCMSFPNLLIKLERHQSCTLTYVDENWHKKSLRVKDDFSELIQHEYDHLNGILATQRALDDQSFKWKA